MGKWAFCLILILISPESNQIIFLYNQGRSSYTLQDSFRELVTRRSIKIQIGIPACVMSSDYITRFSLYLVREKIFEWIKLHRKHLQQIQGNRGGRNFSNCLLREFTAHYAWKNVQMNLKSKTTNIFNSWIINSLQCDYSINEFWFFSSTKRTSIKFRILRVVSREVGHLNLIAKSWILLVRLQKKNKNLEILSFSLEVDLIGQKHSKCPGSSSLTAMWETLDLVWL